MAEFAFEGVEACVLEVGLEGGGEGGGVWVEDGDGDVIDRGKVGEVGGGVCVEGLVG